MLVPDRSALMPGEPTPNTIAAVEVDPVWEGSALIAKLTAKINVNAKATAEVKDLKW
jgi:hypothetical protein